MIVVHGEYAIEVKREKAMGGWDNLYYVVVRQTDDFIALDGFYDGGMTVREAIADLKYTIDTEHRNAITDKRDPWSDDGSGWV